jgi:hypothetical protein
MPTTIELHIQRLPDHSLSARLYASSHRIITDLAPPQAVTISTEALGTLGLLPDAYRAALSAMVFTGPLRGAWERARGNAESEGRGIDLRLQIDDPTGALHALRWELLRDPATNVPLAQQEGSSLARLIPSDSTHAPEPPPQPHLRALIAVAGPSDGQQRYGLAPFDVAGEAARALAALGGIHADTLADTTPGSQRLATLAKIREGLRDTADVMYLICHGKQTARGTVLYLVGDDGKAAPITGDALAAEITALDPAHRPMLAVLVACESADQKDAPLAAVGPLLARAGIPAVIAMQGSPYSSG